MSKSQTLKDFVKSRKGLITIINGAYGNHNVPPGIVMKTITPKEGGTFTRLLGCTFLYKNYATEELMMILDVAKSTLLTFVQCFSNKGIQFYIGCLFLFDRKRFNAFIKNALELYLRIVHRPLKGYLLEPIRYCRVVREIDRVLTVYIERKCRYDDELNQMCFDLKDIILMTLEYDNAYRLRFQDALSGLSKNELSLSSQEAVNKLFDILIEREVGDNMKVKWSKIKKLAMIVVLFNKDIFYPLWTININEIELDPADHYFSLMDNLYNINGSTLEERIIIKKQLDKSLGHNIPEFQKAEDVNK